MNKDIFGNKDKVDICISRVRTNRTDLPEYISIEIADTLSRCQIIEVNLSLEDFAGLITGSYKTEVSAELPSKQAMEKFGKKMETKEEFIDIHSYVNFASEYKKAVKKFEIDGWVADNEKEYNFHRHNTINGYRAIFRRWIHV